jgi:hypothetical protein
VNFSWLCRLRSACFRLAGRAGTRICAFFSGPWAPLGFGGLHWGSRRSLRNWAELFLAPNACEVGTQTLHGDHYTAFLLEPLADALQALSLGNCSSDFWPESANLPGFSVRLFSAPLCEAAFGFGDPLRLWLGEFSPPVHALNNIRWISTVFNRFRQTSTLIDTEQSPGHASQAKTSVVEHKGGMRPWCFSGRSRCSSYGWGGMHFGEGASRSGCAPFFAMRAVPNRCHRHLTS